MALESHMVSHAHSRIVTSPYLRHVYALTYYVAAELTEADRGPLGPGKASTC